MYQFISYLLIICFISLSGCTSKIYKPQISPMKPEMMPAISINKPIHVINTQSNDTYKIFFGTREVQEVNLREATDVAIQILKDELIKKGAAITRDASKVLKLSISKIQYLPTPWGSRCEVQLTVETGGGYNNNYVRNNVGYSAGGVPRGTSCDFAITRTVAAIFEDGSIMDYLNNP